MNIYLNDEVTANHLLAKGNGYYFTASSEIYQEPKDGVILVYNVKELEKINNDKGESDYE